MGAWLDAWRRRERRSKLRLYRMAVIGLHDYEYCYADAGMEQVEEEIVSVDVVYVDVVGVGPLSGPRINDFEPVAGVLKAWLAFNDHRTAYHKSVGASETGAELLVRNVCALACGARVGILLCLAVFIPTGLDLVAFGPDVFCFRIPFVLLFRRPGFVLLWRLAGWGGVAA